MQDVKEINTFLNNNVSFGLMSEDILKGYIGSNWAVVMKEKNQVIGFIRGYEVTDIEKELLGHQDIIHKVLAETKKPLFLVGSLAVSDSYRRRGIGNKLLSQLMQQVETEKEYAYFCLGWKTPVGWHAQNLFARDGFKIVAEQERFWFVDSLEHKYGCQYCADGCTCPAIICIKS